MNIFSKISEVSKTQNIFPNLVTLGSYDPYSQVVCLNYYDRDKLKALDRNNILRYRDFWKLAIHELNHFFDHTSTLWGQSNLVLVHNAISAFLAKQPERFWMINKLKRVSMRIFYPNYFSIKYESAPKIWNRSNCKYQFSAGLEFDHLGNLNPNRPIIFTRFSTSDDIPIARVPISITSLLETNSVSAELISEIGHIQSLEESLKLIELNKIEKDLIKQLYNPDLTVVYSVAAHCLANNNNIKDIVRAYQLSSALSRFCLNLPFEFFQLIKIPNELDRWGNKNSDFLKSYNVGYLYFLLTKIANEYKDGFTIDDWISETIDKAGLPNIEKINKKTSELMIAKKKELINSPLRKRYEYLLDVGLENYKFNGLYKPFSLVEIVNENIIIPPVLLGDDSVFPLPGKSLDVDIYDIEKSAEYSWDYNKFEDDFSQVCIS